MAPGYLLEPIIFLIIYLQNENYLMHFLIVNIKNTRLLATVNIHIKIQIQNANVKVNPKSNPSHSNFVLLKPKCRVCRLGWSNRNRTMDPQALGILVQCGQFLIILFWPPQKDFDGKCSPHCGQTNILYFLI